MKIYDIPRSDKRDRCAVCLKLFNAHPKKQSKKFKGYRFTNVHLTCEK